MSGGRAVTLLLSTASVLPQIYYVYHHRTRELTRTCYLRETGSEEYYAGIPRVHGHLYIPPRLEHVSNHLFALTSWMVMEHQSHDIVRKT